MMRVWLVPVAVAVAVALVLAGCGGSITPSPGSSLTFAPPSASATPTPGGTATPVSPSPSPEPISLSAPLPGGYEVVIFLASTEFDLIVDFAIIPGTGGREAVVITQRRGRFWRLSLDGSFPPTLFGDIASRINPGHGDIDYPSEEGLLSLTFSPDYQTDGLVYVYYTSNDCSGGSGSCSYLSRFPVADNDIREGEEQIILEVEQPHVNHNGGRILFGPDDFLYLSLGDGGGAGDPWDIGQDSTDLLGSVLRLDVSGAGGYRVPLDNPFVDGPGADEVFAYGLRNPWRFSFDRQTGDLWLGDVGQAVWEEVDLVVKGGNYGWNCFEGFDQFDPGGCSQSEFQPPRVVYRHDGRSCSITGGYVYRGADMLELNGWYVYGDYCSGIVWALDTAVTADPIVLVDTNLAISSFAELPGGELLLLAFDNTIYRLVRH